MKMKPLQRELNTRTEAGQRWVFVNVLKCGFLSAEVHLKTQLSTPTRTHLLGGSFSLRVAL